MTRWLRSARQRQNERLITPSDPICECGAQSSEHEPQSGDPFDGTPHVCKRTGCVGFTKYSRYEKYIKPWRRANAEKRNIQRKDNYTNRRFGNGRPWTIDEVKLIHTSELTDTELAAQLRRSVQSIQVKRTRTKPV